ncbi:pre-toxin TG domain-containing protein [Lactiplantibacillus plantarum]|nr:pre-toxin TG domain-containing protein [Lactiplantibacillus plantarum]MBG1238394.1 hypothetical protein [Lactiplantibacillus plantarum subsp. plantarum]MCT3212965.1 hypothetical protein [Lactiplantibacillus plantarum]MCT3269200.1 hypothetical protein [Lactiplantibacillus plantarum]
MNQGIISCLTDLVGYNDIYAMITGKDAATGYNFVTGTR